MIQMKKIIAMLIIVFSFVSINVFSRAEEQPKNLTLMVYVTGSDLESAAGAATSDIAEMLRSGADLDRVNVILCVGGSKRWQSGFPNNQISFYRVEGRRPRLLESRELTSMGDPDTLASFLNYSHEHFPAKQYALILWDHGGGPMNGVCFDELFSNSQSVDSLSLIELRTALQNSPFNSSNPLEWIGFDACLMSSVETAFICAPFARFMIASQETEPGSGWDYSFLKYAADGLSGDEIGQRIIESYMSVSNAGDLMLTLSCIDLSEIGEVEQAMNDLFASLDTMLSPACFSEISNGRRDAKSFGRASTGSEYDLVDLYSLTEQYSAVAPEKARALQSAIDSAVVMNSGNQENSHGFSVYYPYFNKEYYQAGWNSLYGTWGFADQYCTFMSDYAELWLGEPLADWSEVRATALAPMPESQNLQLMLTPEQIDNYAFAQLYIISETSFEEQYYYKIDEIDDVVLTDDGVLHAEYNYNALYVVDENGQPLSDAIPYRIVDGIYLIRANLADKTFEMLLSEVGSGEEIEIDIRKVLLQCVLNPSTDELEIIGIIDMREELGDNIYGMLSEADGFYMGKQSLSIDSQRFKWVSFLRYPREIQYDAAGNPLPYTEWSDPNTGDRIAMEMYDIDNTKPWTLRFCKQQYTGYNLYAQFIVHDTQENLAASDLLPVSNPNLTHVAPPEEAVYASDEASFTLTGIDVADSEFVDGLFLHFDVDYARKDIHIHADNVTIDDYLLGKSYSMNTETSVDDHDRYALLIPSSDIQELAESMIHKIEFDAVISDQNYDELHRVHVVIDLQIDISQIHERRQLEECLSETEFRGLKFRINAAEEDGNGVIRLKIRVENPSNRDVEVDLNGTVVINGCEWDHACSPEEFKLSANRWTIKEVCINELSPGAEVVFKTYDVPQYDYLRRWNTDAIETIDFYTRDNQIIHFELNEPYALDHEGLNAGDRGADLPDEILALDSDDLRLTIKGFFRTEKSIRIITEIANLSSEKVEISPLNAQINGMPSTCSMNTMCGLSSYYPAIEMDAGLRRDVITEIGLEALQADDQPIRSISFSIEYWHGKGTERRFCTPATVLVKDILPGDIMEDQIQSFDPLEVRPAEVIRDEPIDTASIVRVSVADAQQMSDCETVIGVQLSPEQIADFRFAEADLFVSKDDLQYIGTIKSLVRPGSDNVISCKFSGLLFSLDQVLHPMAQIIKTVNGGYEYDLRSLRLSSDDQLEIRYIDYDQLIIRINPSESSASILAAETSRPLASGENLSTAGYTSSKYKYLSGEGSDMQPTSMLLGESIEMEDNVLRLNLRPAADFNPYVVFRITNRKGLTYTVGSYYNECIIDENSMP